jgi:hypothetical protein
MALSILEKTLIHGPPQLAELLSGDLYPSNSIVGHLYYQLIEFRAIDLPSEGRRTEQFKH